MMNYIELINQFWLVNEERVLTPNESKLYFLLLHTSNRLGWKNPFNQSNARLALEAGITEPTLIKARNELKKIGLIEFKSDKGRRNNTVYELKYLKNFSISDSISGSISGSISDSISSKNALDNIKHTLYTYNTSNNKKKNIDIYVDAKKFKEPTVEDVKIYFSEKGYREDVAIKAWEYYNAANWKDSNGKQVKNWKQKMNGVWFKEENKTGKDAQNSHQTNKVNTYPALPLFKGKATAYDAKNKQIGYDDNFWLSISNQEAKDLDCGKLKLSDWDTI